MTKLNSTIELFQIIVNEKNHFLGTLTDGDMEGMYFPVSIYAVVLSVMLWAAGCLFFVKPHSGYDWILIGALSFVASDSLLAINKFCSSLEIQDLSFYVTASYLFAQFAIFNGVIHVHRHKFL